MTHFHKARFPEGSPQGLGTGRTFTERGASAIHPFQKNTAGETQNLLLSFSM